MNLTRSRRRWLAGGIAAGLVLLGCARQAPTATTLRIMPLGDSITQGTAAQPGYRVLLWQRLQDGGAAVDFVGSLSNYFMRHSRAEGFDSDHEGHWGWTSEQLAQRVEPWAKTYRPDIVLMHVGSNDAFGGRRGDLIATDLKEIIQLLRRHNPRVKVLVAQIIPCLSADISAGIAHINHLIASMSQELNTPESPVVAVDQFTGFNAATDTYDGIHPNAVGAQKMAARWFEAMQPML